MCKKILEYIGLNHDRLQIGWVSAAEGTRFAKIISDFTLRIKELGPLGKGKEEAAKNLKLKIEAAKNLVPYIKLVEINKIRLPLGKEVKYNEFAGRDEINRLFQELIGDELIMSEILLHLREKYLSIEEISNVLGLDSPEVSRCLSRLAGKGLIRVDKSQRRFIHTCMNNAEEKSWK